VETIAGDGICQTLSVKFSKGVPLVSNNRKLIVKCKGL
jgi:hypothetical protein